MAECVSSLEIDALDDEVLDSDEEGYGMWLSCETCEWVRNMGTRTTLEALAEAWRIHKAEAELR